MFGTLLKYIMMTGNHIDTYIFSFVGSLKYTVLQTVKFKCLKLICKLKYKLQKHLTLQLIYIILYVGSSSKLLVKNMLHYMLVKCFYTLLAKY